MKKRARLNDKDTEYDIKLADEGLRDYKKNPKTYSIEELLDEILKKDSSR